MDKINLSKAEKRILLQLAENKYPVQVPTEDWDAMNLLEVNHFVTTNKVNGGIFINPQLSNLGKAYLAANPKLKNPSIWDDKKYIVNTVISVVALAVAIIALFK